jgi:septal ring factor EnvC (AmiA/AmiB activator)
MKPSKETTDIEHILEITEKTLYLVTKSMDNDVRQQDKVNKTLEKIDRTIKQINHKLDNFIGPDKETHARLDDVKERLNELDKAVMDRKRLEGEIVKLKKILERKERSQST